MIDSFSPSLYNFSIILKSNPKTFALRKSSN